MLSHPDSDSGDDSDALPPPSLVFARLTSPRSTPTRHRSTGRSSATWTAPTPSAAVGQAGAGAGAAAGEGRNGRRASPRRAQRVEDHGESPRKARMESGRPEAVDAAAAQEHEQERATHAALAALLFPPSPPRFPPGPSPSSCASAPPAAPSPFRSALPPRHEGTVRASQEGKTVISDSEDERQAEMERARRERRREREARGRGEAERAGEKEKEGVEREGSALTSTPRPTPALSSASTARRSRPRPRPSLVFNLSSSSSSDSDADAPVAQRRSGGKGNGEVDEVDQVDEVAESLKELSVRGGKSRPPTSRPITTSAPSSSTTLPPPTLPAPTPCASRTRHKRRLTISVLSSSSSSSSSPSSDSEGESDFRPSNSRPSASRPTAARAPAADSGSDSDALPSPSRVFGAVRTPRACPRAPPALEKKPTPEVVQEEEEEEEAIVVACTDDEAEEGQDSREEGGRTPLRPMQEQERAWPDDVTSVDGVLIYDPTPKKRLVKLTSPTKPRAFYAAPPPAPSPSRSAPSTAGKGKVQEKAKEIKASGLSREIDLTESSSEEDLLPAPRRSIFPSLSSTVSTPRPKSASKPTSTPKPAPTPRARPASPSKPARPAPSTRPTPSDSALLTPSDRSLLPLQLIRELDRLVFRRRWDGLRCLDPPGSEGVGKGLPDGIEVVWNNRLRNTAGRASWRTTRTSSPSKPHLPPRIAHSAQIELATKVTDTRDKLKHTLAHELCHLAAWSIDGEMKPPHGGSFKAWAARIMLVRPDISVTTTHSYEIVYKYRWQCTRATCGKIFGRHSKSIDPSTHGCPCGARLVQLDKDGKAKTAPAAGAAGAGGTETPRKKSKWQEFLALNSPLVRREQPTLPQSEVFKVVAERWKVAKAEAAAAGTGEGAAGGKGKSVSAGAGGLEEALESLEL